jgi:hypothetical protein
MNQIDLIESLDLFLEIRKGIGHQGTSEGQDFTINLVLKAKRSNLEEYQ